MTSEAEEWEDKERIKLDLILENQSLETDLSLQGGVFFKPVPVDPELENAFLKNIQAFEDADKEPGVPLLSLFPQGYEFPPVESLTPEQVCKKLDEIDEVFSMKNIFIDFPGDVPDSVAYKFLSEKCIPFEKASGAVGGGFALHIDGCDGSCEDCFQKEYCDAGKEILDEDNG